MEARTSKLLEYLETDSINKIPVYQRNYSWKKEQCEQLFNDILHAGENENIELHFIGSVIIVKGGDGIDTIHSVVDGQQRITTTTLLLKAIFDHETSDDFVQGFVEPSLLKKTRRGNKNKLVLNKNDNSALIKILNNQNEFLENDKKTKVFKNYQIFKNLLNLKKPDFEILEKGLKKLMVVVITLQQNENPQLIFEALNSTGMKLTQADLIRNHLLMREVERQNELYEKYWYQIEQNLTNDHIESFAKSFLIIKLSELIKETEIYSHFKTYIEKNKLSSEEALQELLFYSKEYQKFMFKINFKDDDLKLAIERIMATGKEVFVTIMLELCAKFERDEISKNDVLKVLALLENYLIRHAILRFSSNAYNKFVPTIIKNLDSYEKFERKLVGLQGKNLVFVPDRVLRNELKNADIYNTKHLAKTILYRIEQTLSKEVVKDDVNVEHIFPQTVSTKWKKALPEEWKEIKNDYLHSIGNLTLTGLNSELSNKIFSQKKEVFLESNISLNKYFKNIRNWDKEEIEKRADVLTSNILEIWKEPKLLNQLEIEKEFFLSDQRVITGQRPESFEIFEQAIDVKDWKNLYILAVTEIYNKYEESFNKHIDNNGFNKNSRRKVSIISKDKEEMKEFQEIEYTFYLNTYKLSPKQALSKLSEIIEVLNIEDFSDDDILITLK
ncbi:hypothetical protein ThvES_00016810 [Thiovulum sp. ES]|nr:hypothetical protein ThvES_00016810 [Thiovulum sp. ES]